MREISAQIPTMGPPKVCEFHAISFGNMAIIRIERAGALEVIVSGDRNKLRAELLRLAHSLEFRTVAERGTL